MFTPNIWHHAHAVDLVLVVHEMHQRKGYGRALLAYLIGWAKSNPKVEKIMLHVRSSNEGALALYKNMGFVIEGVRVKQIKLGPDLYLDNIAMAGPLGRTLVGMAAE